MITDVLDVPDYGEYLVGNIPNADNLQNIVVALEDIEAGETGPVAYNSADGCGDMPKVLFNGLGTIGDSIGTVTNQWYMETGKSGFTLLSSDGPGLELFKEGGLDVRFGTVSDPPLFGPADVALQVVNDDGTKTATGVVISGVIPGA